MAESEFLVMSIKIWAHRGASAYAPENTMEAFAEAVVRNADGIELDIHLTADNVIVVGHDNTIDRCSTGTGTIEEMTLEQLRSYTYGKFYEKYRDARIPTLAEVFDYMRNTTAGFINIELKTGSHGEIEPRLAKLVNDMDMQERVIYSSFSLEMLDLLKEIEPRSNIALLYGTAVAGVDDIVELAVAHKMKALHPNYKGILGTDLVERCRKVGIDVNAYTVNDAEALMKCYEEGVHAVITNYPDIAYETLAEFNARK